jgi:HNH endonuclease
MVKTEVIPETGCVEWRGMVNDQGYGLLKLGGKKRTAHKLLWEVTWGGDVEPGYELHRICGNRRCLNPEHLEMLTRKEHVAKSPNNILWANKHGHEFTPEKTPTSARIGADTAANVPDTGPATICSEASEPRQSQSLTSPSQ